MPAQNRLQTVRESFGAYESGDREVLERMRLFEHGDEVVGEEVRQVEVYFGWDL